MFCYKCGGEIPENKKFCPDCGEIAHGHEHYANSNNENNNNKNYSGSRDYTASFHPDDINANKGIALVSYILFFIPLLVVPNSKFARFHVNQGLIVFILAIIANVINNIFNMGKWWGWRGWDFWYFTPFSVISGLLQAGIVLCIILGIVNAVNGKAVELPLVGKFRLIV